LKVCFLARQELVEAAFWGGSPEKALVAYSWLLAQFDRHPGEFDEWRLLWRYKWMIGVVADFPQIPKAQIEEMLEDMERRFRRGGYGLRSVFQYRYRIARFMGERERALKFYKRSQSERTDAVSDCRACQIDERVSYHVYTGDDERAHQLAQPLLDFRQFCRTVPERTFARLLLPMLRLNRADTASGPAAELTAARGGETAAALRLPPTFPLYDEVGVYDTARLRDWFAERTLETARKFDERNGNDHFTREQADLDVLRRSAEPVVR
jgi:hypothetical protein